MRSNRPHMNKCYRCEYRGGVPGSAHSSCNHPIVKQETNPLGKLAAILGKIPVATSAATKLGIRGDMHGIASGWFAWPYNFDPVWLENCDGFEAKEGESVREEGDT